jgi:hypothetical protein
MSTRPRDKDGDSVDSGKGPKFGCGVGIGKTVSKSELSVQQAAVAVGKMGSFLPIFH